MNDSILEICHRLSYEMPTYVAAQQVKEVISYVRLSVISFYDAHKSQNGMIYSNHVFSTENKT